MMGHGHKSYGNAFGHQLVVLAIYLFTERSFDNNAARTVAYKNQMTIPGSCCMALVSQDLVQSLSPVLDGILLDLRRRILVLSAGAMMLGLISAIFVESNNLQPSFVRE